MRCLLCGADNADSQLTCWNCGSWLPTRRVEDQVDQMMERLSAAASEQAERESLFIRALEVSTQDMDTSWLEDAESRLLTSRSASNAARRDSELDARAAAFVSDARMAIDFPPIGAVDSPRSDPTASDSGYRRSLESRARSGRTRPSSRHAVQPDASMTPPPAHRKRKHGPRQNKSVVPVVSSAAEPQTKRRKAAPAEPKAPAYAAETRLDAALQDMRSVLSDATGALFAAMGDLASSTGEIIKDAIESTADLAVGNTRADAEHPFGAAQNVLVEESPYEAFPEGMPEDIEDEAWAMHADDELETTGSIVQDELPNRLVEVPAESAVRAETWQVFLDELSASSRAEADDGGSPTVPEKDRLEETARDDASGGGVSSDADDEVFVNEAYLDQLVAEVVREGNFAEPTDDDEPEESADQLDGEEELLDEVLLAATHDEAGDEADVEPEPEPEPEPDVVPEPEPEAEPEREQAIESMEPDATELMEPGETELLEPGATELIDSDGTPEPEATSETDDEAESGDAPVERTFPQTVLRPVVAGRQEPLANGGHFVIRNTRDYDHDAQSTNLVNAGDQFDTLTESRDARKLRNDPYARSKRRGYVPGEGNSRGLMRPLLAVLLVAFVLTGGGAVLTYGLEMWGGKSVPVVTGYQQASAEQRLSQKGFVAVIKAEPADDAIGIVTKQSPEPGERAPEGSEIVLYVATNRTVPDVMGLTEAEARTVLEKSGAENIVSVVESSTEPEGTVIGVDPGVGEPFVSRVELKLTIAGPYIVPDVLTKKEQDAIEAIEKAGFVANVTYVNSDQTVRTVVETSPAAGTAYEKGGTVELRVSAPYPSDPYHLAEFFDHSSQDDNDYLLKQGFSFEGGAIESGQALAVYTSSDKGNVSFSATPHAHQLKVANKDEANALASGMPFSGVRVDLPSWYAPGGYDESSLLQIAELCGFSGLTDSCNNLTITLPANVTRLTVPFGCASGTMGDLVWTVLVVGDGDSVPLRVSATCSKEGVYAPSDLIGFGGNVSQYAAYQEVYASKEYEPKPDPKAEEGDKKDKKDGESDKKDGEGTDASADANAGTENKDATDEQHDTAAA